MIIILKDVIKTVFYFNDCQLLCVFCCGKERKSFSFVLRKR